MTTTLFAAAGGSAIAGGVFWWAIARFTAARKSRKAAAPPVVREVTDLEYGRTFVDELENCLLNCGHEGPDAGKMAIGSALDRADALEREGRS